MNITPDMAARYAELDAGVAGWNEALASGDADRAERVKTALLDQIHRRIMDDDAAYAAAGWTVTR